MVRKDKNDSAVFRRLLSLDFDGTWDSYTDNEAVNDVLAHASKSMTGKAGFPDYLYVNANKKLLILVEIKPSVRYHKSSEGFCPEKYAVDGIRHYLGFFEGRKLSDRLRAYFSGWGIVGIAVSGSLEDPYGHRISTFVIHDGAVESKSMVSELLDEESYLNLFVNIDEEIIVSKVSSSSKKINKWLRSIDSQKRPILLSALMICLYRTKKEPNDFISSYPGWSAKTTVDNIVPTLRRVLKEERIPQEKIDVIVNELAFIETDQDLNDQKELLLRKILDELNDVVLPLFDQQSHYDIVGKFYEEFLRFAGVANVKKGIVLTPKHVTALFTELIDIKYNDVVVDYACGTGTFLIAAMRKIHGIIDESDIPDKEALKNRVKSEQLIGFEKNATMYTCAISNMMFRGDGKSNINYCDCFSSEADERLAELASRGIRPTIGFINPPYGGKDNKDNPTKKEVQFLVKMLDSVSRYGIIIAPLSTFFKDDDIRSAILLRHTLKCVVNMPHDLFMPNAATDTAIAVFEANRPQGDQKVVFTEIADDGLVLSKAKGRTDIYGRWPGIQKGLLERLADPGSFEDGRTLVQHSVSHNDEWILQAYAKIDYQGLTTADFVLSIKKRLVYVAKRELGLLDKTPDEITLLEVLSEFYSTSFGRVESEPVDTSDWDEFRFDEVFAIRNGTRLTKQDMAAGPTNFLGAIQDNNGVREQIGEDPLFPGNAITVNYNGSVGEAFYQSEPYWPSDDVYTLELLDGAQRMNVYTALFLTTLIRLHKQNFFYGRKWSSSKMSRSLIKLPAKHGNPDWDQMESFVKGLPYASFLEEE